MQRGEAPPDSVFVGSIRGMNLDELETYVVERLSAGVAPGDVILEVTERSELTWPEAEQLVRRTADLRASTVAKRQFPLLAVIAAAVIVTGLAVLAACALSFSDVWLLLKPGRGALDHNRLTAAAALLAANAPMLSLIPLGAGMILGGIIGLVRALQATEPTD
jgi:hypothetical protein